MATIRHIKWWLWWQAQQQKSAETDIVMDPHFSSIQLQAGTPSSPQLESFIPQPPSIRPNPKQTSLFAASQSVQGTNIFWLTQLWLWCCQGSIRLPTLVRGLSSWSTTVAYYNHCTTRSAILTWREIFYMSCVFIKLHWDLGCTRNWYRVVTMQKIP